MVEVKIFPSFRTLHRGLVTFPDFNLDLGRNHSVMIDNWGGPSCDGWGLIDNLKLELYRNKPFCVSRPLGRNSG